jgi:hypothetical protein
MSARRVVILVVALLAITGTARGGAPDGFHFLDTQYEPVNWTELDGLAVDDHATAFAAFLESCRALNNSRQPGADTSPPMADAL